MKNTFVKTAIIIGLIGACLTSIAAPKSEYVTEMGQAKLHQQAGTNKTTAAATTKMKQCAVNNYVCHSRAARKEFRKSKQLMTAQVRKEEKTLQLRIE